MCVCVCVCVCVCCKEGTRKWRGADLTCLPKVGPAEANGGMRFFFTFFLQGAVVTCLAKGGPAEANGGLLIGDTVVFVNDLHVPSLLERVSE